MHSHDVQRLRNIVRCRLESLERAGMTFLPKPKTRRPLAATAITITPTAASEMPTTIVAATPSIHPVASPFNLEAATARKTLNAEVLEMAAASIKKTGAVAKFEIESDSAKPREASTAATLEILQQDVASCTRCDELARTRTQTVFGVGHPKAELCFLGEAPGADEDRTGIPFVGRAGQLLTKIIEACTLKREDVYILNMIKCRPPGNRNPLPHELANCRHFLDRQLELIGPKYICCLGAVAAQNLLQTQVPIGRLRGKIHDYRDMAVVCTYHPAYLLRNPAAKKDTWDDMKMLMREMGIEL